MFWNILGPHGSKYEHLHSPEMWRYVVLSTTYCQITHRQRVSSKQGYTFLFSCTMGNAEGSLSHHHARSQSQTFRSAWFMHSGRWGSLLSIYVDNVMIYEMTSPNEYVWNKCSDMWLVTSPQHSLVSQILTQLLRQVCTSVQRGGLIWTFSGRGFHSGQK